VQALATDVNAMADSVQASQRALREFLANVSHELKTPLTSIRGFSQAMHDGTLDTPEERARAARVIDVESSVGDIGEPSCAILFEAAAKQAPNQRRRGRRHLPVSVKARSRYPKPLMAVAIPCPWTWPRSS